MGDLAQHIPQRDLDTGFCEGMTGYPAVHTKRKAFDCRRIFADQERRQVGVNAVNGGCLVFPAPDRRTRHLAQPDQPFIGVHLDQHKGGLDMAAATAVDCPLLVDRYTHRDRFDVRNLHLVTLSNSRKT